MKKFLATLLITFVLMFGVTGCQQKADDTTNGGKVVQPVITKDAADSSATVHKYETDANGNALTTPTLVQQQIDKNNQVIEDIKIANKYLATLKGNLQDAIDAMWLWITVGVFGLIAAVITAYAIFYAPLGTKSKFLKFAAVVGSVAVAAGTLATYIAYLKYLWLVCGLGLLFLGAVYFHQIVKALFGQVVAGKLDAEATNLPIVGHLVADANTAAAKLQSDISDATYKAVDTVKADVTKAAPSVVADVKTEVTAAEAKVQSEVK